MENIVKKLSIIYGYVACLCVAALTVLVFISVLMRYVFNSPLMFGDEISDYMLLGIVFAGLGYTMQVGGHIRVDVVVMLLPEKIREKLFTVIHFIFLLYSLIFMSGIMVLFWDYLQRKTKAFTILETPLVWPALLMVIGSLLLVIETIRLIYCRLRQH